MPEGIVNRPGSLTAIKSPNALKAKPRGASRFQAIQRPESPIRYPESNCLDHTAFRQETDTKDSFPVQQAAKTVANSWAEEDPAGVMDLLPLSPNDFKCYFTLFSKYFSSFVHTTCSLSVSVQYLAFAEVHLRVCTALSNCTTLGTPPISGH